MRIVRAFGPFCDPNWPAQFRGPYMERLTQAAEKFSLSACQPYPLVILHPHVVPHTFVIPSGARNLSFFGRIQTPEGFLAPLGMTIRMGVFPKPVQSDAHQIWQRMAAGRAIGSPSLQPNALANSSMFEGAAMARKRPSGCGLVFTMRRSNSGRSFEAQICA